MRRRRVGWAIALLTVAACGDNGEPDRGGTATAGITGGGTGTDGGDDGDGSSDDGLNDGDDGCLGDFECGDGEICLDGSCCAAEAACGDSCCGETEICHVGSCVVPGASCTTNEDCGSDEYCELALGEEGGGFGTPDPGQVCLEELPATGACLTAPSICGDPGADPDNCLEQCEFETEAGALETVTEWQWGQAGAATFPEYADVWATPTVARIYDANCDGRVDVNDPPNLVFVAGDSNETCCSCTNAETACRTGVLRVLNGRNGEEVWSLDKPDPAGAFGFAGMSVALGDMTGDGYIEIVAATGDYRIAVVDRHGAVLAISADQVADQGGNFGWGGGIAVGDMNGDGDKEIAYGASVFTFGGGMVTKLFDGAGGTGGGGGQALSYFVDLDGDGSEELLAGNTAYSMDGSMLWQTGIADGFTAVGDLDVDGTPEVVVVKANVWVLDGATGAIEIGPVDIPLDDEHGGPPTIADFDGDGVPEIGIAGGDAYVMFDANFAGSTLGVAWTHDTKDHSSARTGSSVFDFEGDGRAEVIYSDECFLRILDGVTGDLRYAAPNTTFTATEAIIVADVDGDDHAEVVRVSNSANWDCNTAPWNQPDPATGRPAWVPPMGQTFYRGVTVFGDERDSWVGTRKMWNQHAYYVSNVCDGEDGACDENATYGELPANLRDNWSLPWLNNFRQNVKDGGLKNAPDAQVSVNVECGMPPTVQVAVRNGGLAVMPAGVEAEVHRADDDSLIGTVVTTVALLAGQSQVLEVEVPEGAGGNSDAYYARIVIDPDDPSVKECDDTNNESEPDMAYCGAG